jgi:sugar phosphate isomerase/epimerase
VRIALNTLPLETDLATALIRAEAIGADALEIQCHADYLEGTDARRVASSSGFPCSGGVAMMNDGRSLISPDRNVRETTITYLNDCLRFVGDIGGSVLTISPTQPTLPLEVGWDEAMGLCIEGLERCAAVSDSSGVKLAIEPINRYRTGFINRCDQAFQLVKDLDPSLGVCPDLFHVLIEETDWELALSALGPRLLNLQVAENTRRVPGRGRFEWEALIELLWRIDYSGDIVIEMPRIDILPPHPGTGTVQPVSDDDIDAELSLGVERLRSAIASARNRVIVPAK